MLFVRAPRAARRTFRRGVHPPDTKAATAGRPVEAMPFVPEYVLPLGQHIGAPSKPIVTAGDRVIRGQRIAEAGGFVSVALHAPVTGTVTAVELRPRPGGSLAPAIVIATDPFASQRLPTGSPLDMEDLGRDRISSAMQDAGLVGLGGAAFPTHVKLSVPKDKRVKSVLVNGCECEPYLTCDHRAMVERPEAVVRGTVLLMGLTGAERAYIGVEANKPDALDALRAVAPPAVTVVPLEVKYPQGAEKMLVAAVLGKEIPTGALPLDVEALVNNVSSVAALADLLDRGLPLIERVVTVTGPAIAEPKNLRVPLGTPVSALIAHCGGLLPSAWQVVLGGPMMGMSLSSLEVPTLKGTSGVLCLDRKAPAAAEALPCIRCARCVGACPMRLNPSRLARLAEAGRTDELEAAHLNSCFECGSCAFVCPSSIPLVHWMRMGKALMREAKAKQ